MRHLARFLCTVFSVSIAASAEAVQIITPSTDGVTVGTADTVLFAPVYSVSGTTTESSTGLGLRVHFDSSALTPGQVQNVFAYGVQPQGEVLADVDNLDGDAATDSYFILAWLDTSAQWPGAGETPLTLANIGFTPKAGFTGVTNIRTTATATADDTAFESTPMMVKVGENSGISLRVRGLLQGAYSATEGLMRDDLRAADWLPLDQPYVAQGYSGTESATPSLLSVSGNNAVVDWVLVELRHKFDPNIEVLTRAALLQRDGDVVDAATGNDVLTFPKLDADLYYVALRHRNHLGVMTAAPVSLSGNAVLTDFALEGTAVYGSTDTRFAQGTLRLLSAGDANSDNKLIAAGPGTDRNSVLGSILDSVENTGKHVNYQLQGYSVTDLNMDGKTLFVGPGNDINILLSNILLAPENSTSSTNYILSGTSPN